MRDTTDAGPCVLLPSIPIEYYLPMKSGALSKGTVHTLPADIRDALRKNAKASAAWETLTPLARNEWICWTISVKKAETRKEHVDRLIADIAGGKRRPCCWIGCIHRTDKAMSPSVKGILGKRKQK